MKWSFHETRAGFTYEVTAEAKTETPNLKNLSMRDLQAAVFDPTSGVIEVKTRLVEADS